MLSVNSIKNYFTSTSEIGGRIKYLFDFYPKNIYLYKLAFRHKSAAKVNADGHRISNERLEFLGDAILGAIVADILFKKYPYASEGFLTEMRSKIVSRAQLNSLALKLGFKELIETEIPHKNLGKSIYGDAFEAFVGAVYLDQGYKFTREILLKYIINSHFDIDQLEVTEVNYKSKLIIWSQKNKKTLEFKVDNETIENKIKTYHVGLYIEGTKQTKAVSTSIKKAEQLAAEAFMNKLPDEESKA